MARKPKPKVAALPRTTSPSWPDELNRVKLDTTSRRAIRDYIIHSICDAREKELKEAGEGLFEALLYEHLGDKRTAFEALPEEWLQRVSSIYVQLNNRPGVRLPAKGGSAVVPASLVQRNDPDPSPELRKLIDRHREHKDDFEAARRQLQQTLDDLLKNARTVGAFLGSYPSAVEHIPAEFLGRLAVEAPSTGRGVPALADQQLKSLIAKVQGRVDDAAAAAA